MTAKTGTRVTADARHHLIDIGARVDQAEARHSTDLGVQIVSSYPIPEVSAEVVDVLVSNSGTAALVAWQDGNLLRYRETIAEGWSPVRSIRLDAKLTITEAHRILERRIRDR